MRRWPRTLTAAIGAALCATALAPSAQAYLKLGQTFAGRVLSLKWSHLPIRYFVSDVGVPGVTSQQLQQSVSQAFATWDAVPSVSLSSQFVGFTSALPFENDSMSVIGYLSRPDLDRVLGETTFSIDTITGEIIESDIFLNSSFPWSVSAAGEAGKFDVQTIVLHEIGHLHGLGHSGLGETELINGGRRVIAKEAIMFPIAFSPGSVNDRTLRADDIAGISDLYGTTAFKQATGSVSGRVTKNGTGVIGAHVVAFNPRTSKLVAGFTFTADGSFVIAGLDPGPQVLRVEPLDDADLNAFFDTSTQVDVNFKSLIFDQLVVVPPGGTSRTVELKVVGK